VYLFDSEERRLSLRAAQGRPETAFAKSVLVPETLLGRALDAGEAVQEADAVCGGPSTGWLSAECEIRSHAAVPLQASDALLGVIVLASHERRELSAAEMGRFTVLGNQSAVSLQNALLHDEIQRLSDTDRLTDLCNNAYLKKCLNEEFDRSARYRHDLSVIMMDIDNFKAFNDTYGHLRGDAVLRALGGVIRENSRTADVAARYGGEEFVLMLPETGTAGAMAVAERIRAGVEALRIEGSEGVPVVKTVSVGVATFPAHAASALRLLESADEAMYRAKHAGKNRVFSAEP
jgi:diguanylate cyclase (GGDEF)-like protein